MVSKKKVQTTKRLDSFCQSQSFLKTRIAYMTFYDKKYPDWAEMLLAIFEYLQLMSQALLLRPSLYENPSTNDKFLFRAVVYFFKLVNPSALLSYKDENTITTTVILIVFMASLCKVLLFFYVVMMALLNYRGLSVLNSLWRFVFKTQTRVLYYFITSFWIREILAALEEGFPERSIGAAFIISVAVVMISIEVLFSLLIEAQLSYVLPTKNLLASKSNQTQFITLLQKITIQIMILSIRTDSLTNTWAFSILNLVFCILRNAGFYISLPFYDFKALFLHGDLLNVVFALNVACFFQTLLRNVDHEKADINFTIILWILLSVLMIKIFRELLMTMTRDLLTKPIKGPPELLVHKIQAVKELKKDEKISGKNSTKYDWNHLLNLTENVNIQAASFLHSKQSLKKTLDLNDRKVAHRVYLQYLEDLQGKYPNSSLMKLYIAYMCSKKSDLYAKAIKVAIEMGKSRWSMSQLTSSFLLFEVEKAIVNDYYKEGGQNLDLFTYIKSENYVDDLKNLMLKESEHKITICDNILNETSDIGEIYDCAQKIAKLKRVIQRKMNNLHSVTPDYNNDPLLLCAEYQLMLNYSLEGYFKFHESHFQKYYKYEKLFKASNLTEENMYQETNAFLLLSGQKIDNGKINFVTKAIQKVCGGDKVNYLGAHVSTLFPGSLQSYYQDLFKQTSNTGKKTPLNKITRAFIQHKDKYLIEADFYLRFHPYVTQNLYLNMIIRPVNSTKQYLLIKEDGELEGATRRISNTLQIRDYHMFNSGSALYVRMLSEELHQMNEAFNIVHKVQLADKISKGSEGTKSEELGPSLLSEISNRLITSKRNDSRVKAIMDYNKALELYNQYTTEGRKIEFFPIKDNLTKNLRTFTNNTYSYLCKVTVQAFGSVLMKIVSLEEIGTNEGLEYNANIVYGPRTSKTLATTERKALDGQFQVNELDMASEVVSENSENVNCEERANNEVAHHSSKFNQTTDVNLLSPKSDSQIIFPLLSAKIGTQVPMQSARVPISLTGDSDDSSDEPEKLQKKKKNNNKKYVPKYVSSHHSSQTSQERSFNKAFRRAITSRSYPKTFIILCVVFYGVIIITFLSQILLTKISEATLSDLAIHKNLLKYAQLRLYKTILSQVNARGGSLQLLGSMATGNAVQGIDGVITNFKIHLADMLISNKQIFEGIYTLDSWIQDKLFEKDIQLKGNYLDSKDNSTKNVTNFQSIEIYGTAIQRFTSLPQPVSQEGYEALAFLSDNMLDHFLIKSKEITNLFTGAVEAQKEYLQNIITICLIVTPLLLSGIAFILIIIIWKQYTAEKNHLLGFIKLQPKGVRQVLSNLTDFRDAIVNEESFRNRNSYIMLENQTRNGKLPEDSHSSYKKNFTQVIRYSKIRRRYATYIIQVIFFITILIAVMLVNFLTAYQSTKTIYKKQDQLQFANYISARVSVSYCTFAELFSVNNSAYVEGQLPLPLLTSLITEIQELETQTPDKFLNLDKTYDPEVKAILFDNIGCERFNATALLHCGLLKGTGAPMNLLSTMGAFENLLKTKIIDYRDADKSSMGTILAAAYININTLLPLFTVVASEAHLIGEVIDKDINRSIENAKEQRIAFTIVFSVSLAIVSLFIWIAIFVRLRETNNDFKKVLQVLPPNLILSSFLLKTFLKKTSRDIPRTF